MKNPLKEIGKDYNELEEKCITWHFIGSPIDDTIDGLEFVLSRINKAKYDHPVKFMDIGCGMGNILLIAKVIQKLLFPRLPLITYGIEHNPELVRLGDSLKCGYIYQKDAFNQNYTDIDIIYYYQPIQAREIMAELERKIEKEAKVGAYIMSCLKVDDRIEKDKRFRFCERFGFGSLTIWEKISH